MHRQVSMSFKAELDVEIASRCSGNRAGPVYLVLGFCFAAGFLLAGSNADPEQRNLVDQLFYRQNYNPLIRPVENISETIRVKFEMSLIQIIMLDERNQIMKTNIWLRLKWTDYQFSWEPEQFGGIQVLRIMSDRVWKPDIVLFNNADGRFEVSFKANVLVNYDTSVMWIPCAIYKSSCDIDVEYFPFDEQSCDMIFGSWTYDGNEVDLEPYTTDFLKVDLSDYMPSGSWDVFDVVANWTETVPPDGGPKESRAVYTIKMRRKTLFYTVNLIIPSALVSSLSTAVFYLPATAGERITMSVSILLALVVFLQVLVTNILPPSSINLPLYAKYVLFTIILDVCCITNTVVVLNWTNKTPRTHRMPGWCRTIFINWLPRILLMQRPAEQRDSLLSSGVCGKGISDNEDFQTVAGGGVIRLGPTPETVRRAAVVPNLESFGAHHPECPFARMSLRQRHNALHKGGSSTSGLAGIPGDSGHSQVSPEITKAIEAVRFVGAHIKNEDDFDEVVDDWRYVSLVIDRTLFLIFLIVTVVATCTILIKTPLFDSFTQQDYIDENKAERSCKDVWQPYDPEKCDDWYPILCEKHPEIYSGQCTAWRNATYYRNLEKQLA